LDLKPAPTLGKTRAMLTAEAEENMNFASMTNAISQVMYFRLALFSDANLLDEIPKVLGMYSLYPRELGEILGTLWKAPQAPSGLADFLGVAHVNVPGKVTVWETRPTYLPWVTAGQKPVRADRDEILSRIVAADFDARRTVFLPSDANGGADSIGSAKASISGERFSAHKIEFDIDAPAPAIAVISQTFYHNWRAYVAGKQTQLLRANHAFQALEVPAGHHHVVLSYVDLPFYIGAGISLTAVAVWLALWVRSSRKPDESRLSSPPR
jgi:hypothetical protein